MGHLRSEACRPTEERAKNLAFPAIYYYSPTVLAVHKDNTSILSPSDATGKRIGALKGSIFEKYVRHEPMGMADELPPVYKINNPVVVSSRPRRQHRTTGQGRRSRRSTPWSTT